LLGQASEDNIYGIVPPISSNFKNYDFEGIRENAYHFDPEKARKLIAEAGYPEGKGFGNVTLRFNIGDIESAVAAEFADQISKTLGINVNIDGSSFEQKTKDANFLKGDIFRTAWSADYCSPETFLQSFYGKFVPQTMNEPSTINQSRYKNAAFDDYFEKGRAQKKVSSQLKYFNLAEKELMKDPPLIVLWYASDSQIIYSRVRNFQYNPMNYIYLREVYIKPWTKEEYQNQMMK
jgi:ABC-type oligopeptide transport system substrate-binding subunit